MVLYGASALTPTTAMCATLRYRFQSCARGVDHAEHLVGAQVLGARRRSRCSRPSARRARSWCRPSPRRRAGSATTIFWFRCFSISAAVTRVTWSVEPPAAQGTMMVMGLLGCHCAWPRPLAASSSGAAAAGEGSESVSCVSPVLIHRMVNHWFGIGTAVNRAQRAQSLRTYPRITSHMCDSRSLRAFGVIRLRPKIADSVWLFDR